MKKTALLFVTVLTVQVAIAQLVIKDSLNNGIGNIYLGDSLSKYQGYITALHIIGEGKRKAETIYSYDPIAAVPLNIGGVDFRLAMLTFDTSLHISFFSISKMYNPTNDQAAPKQGRLDYKKILAYLETIFQTKGIKKVIYDDKNSSLKGYEWKRTSSTINFNIQEDTRSNVVFISLDFKANPG